MLCDVLEYLHTLKENPIVFLDLKPDNVMLTDSGRVKLIDFGIAKECRRGKKQDSMNIGSRGFAAPEQYSGGSNIYDERTDIYSLGATLFTLITGIAPGVPPCGLRPVRQVNPALSEGLEYIISKCTQDDPLMRYQNCRELREDLDNIVQLTSEYRSKMQKRLVKFFVAFGMSLICCAFILTGYWGIQRNNQDNYITAFVAAENFEKEGQTSDAQKQYIEAIKNRPNAVEAYQKLFNIMLPANGNKDYVKKTEYAIDTMRTYVDDRDCPMYHDCRLMCRLIKECISVNDLSYAKVAMDYISEVKKSDDYKNKKIDTNEIDGYAIVASNRAMDLDTQNFSELSSALLKLEENTDQSNMAANDKLNNYYNILIIYSTYPLKLPNSYANIVKIGEKSKKIIEENAQSELFTFNNIIPLYELVASNIYDSAIINSKANEKYAAFQQSLKWFGYLDDLNDNLSEPLWLKKANANKNIFELYNTINVNGQRNKAPVEYLNSAIKIYNNILKANSQNFLASVYLTQAYIDAESVKSSGRGDFTQAKITYQKVLTIKNKNKNLTSIELAQFSSLKVQMENAGLEV